MMTMDRTHKEHEEYRRKPVVPRVRGDIQTLVTTGTAGTIALIPAKNSCVRPV